MADNSEELPASSSAGPLAGINVSPGTNKGLPAPTKSEVTDNYIREVLGQLQKQQPQHGGPVSNSITNNTGSSINLNDNISWLDPQIYLKSLNSSGSSVELTSVVMELRLSRDELSLLKQELTEFGNRKRAMKKQLQSLAGKLNWASTVVHGGRVFLRRIIDSITQLQHDWHEVLIKWDIMQDILW
ncbi:unnamed protein product [Mytilus coruscus]|uniref:Uncharacterized protein n=1 Tax=Mytilus coruscus TaxID=42192 RepID=A0A6J8AUK2_MYTCO|nr:unnamed protein product [Mytilus coruscus]